MSANVSQGKVSILSAQHQFTALFWFCFGCKYNPLPFAPLQHASMLECACHIISYLADVMNALRQSGGQGSSTMLVEGEEKAIEVDSDWVEDLAVEEDDSQAEDSVRRLLLVGRDSVCAPCKLLG